MGCALAGRSAPSATAAGRADGHRSGQDLCYGAAASAFMACQAPSPARVRGFSSIIYLMRTLWRGGSPRGRRRARSNLAPAGAMRWPWRDAHPAQGAEQGSEGRRSRAVRGADHPRSPAVRPNGAGVPVGEGSRVPSPRARHAAWSGRSCCLSFSIEERAGSSRREDCCGWAASRRKADRPPGMA